MTERINPLLISYTTQLCLLPFENYKTLQEIKNEQENSILKSNSNTQGLFSGLPFGFTKISIDFLTKYFLEKKLEKIDSKPLQKVLLSLFSTVLSFPFEVMRKRKVKESTFEDPTHVHRVTKKYFKGLSPKIIFDTLSIGLTEFALEKKIKIVDDEILNKGILLGLSKLLLYPFELISSRVSTNHENISVTAASTLENENISGFYKSSWTSVLQVAFSTGIEFFLK
jgi:hypothetical protein